MEIQDMFLMLCSWKRIFLFRTKTYNFFVELREDFQQTNKIAKEFLTEGIRNNFCAEYLEHKKNSIKQQQQQATTLVIKSNNKCGALCFCCLVAYYKKENKHREKYYIILLVT